MPFFQPILGHYCWARATAWEFAFAKQDLCSLYTVKATARKQQHCSNENSLKGHFQQFHWLILYSWKSSSTCRVFLGGGWSIAKKKKKIFLPLQVKKLVPVLNGAYKKSNSYMLSWCCFHIFFNSLFFWEQQFGCRRLKKTIDTGEFAVNTV